MEDASLDDFFAKKDKSKKKSKSSKITPTDIINKTDEPVKKEKKKKDKDKSQASANTANNISTGLTDEEWKEVEEEKEKDYSGLRIANLQVSEKPESENDEQAVENEEEEGDDGEVKEKKDTGQQGPWKASGAAPPPVTAPEPVPEPPKEEPKSTGKYIPPSQRAAAAAGATGASSGPTVPAHLRKKKNAPNLKSEEDFPTLGGGPMPVDSDTRNFERVQYGGRQMDNPGKDTQQLSLGNKFSALQD